MRPPPLADSSTPRSVPCLSPFSSSYHGAALCSEDQNRIRAASCCRLGSLKDTVSLLTRNIHAWPVSCPSLWAHTLGGLAPVSTATVHPLSGLADSLQTQACSLRVDSEVSYRELILNRPAGENLGLIVGSPSLDRSNAGCQRNTQHPAANSGALGPLCVV